MPLIIRNITIFLAFLSAVPAVYANGCLPPACTAFPADSGIINVKDFGAKGNGVTDDTAAINAALAASGSDTGPAFWQDKIVYMPGGTYLVSAPLMKRYANGKFASGFILIGQERDKTIIKLKDQCASYGDPAHPRPILFTSSKLLDGSPTSGGKDYEGKGEGNDAYMNFIEHLTVDTGENNLGAIGIDYLANNEGAIRDVVVRADLGSGHTGIRMTRNWPGPLLLKNVMVKGFGVGIDVAGTEYGVTMEDIHLQNEVAGLRNNHNVVAVHGITTLNVANPIVNLSHDGLMVIDKGDLKNAVPGGEAVVNQGYINIHDVTVKGYENALGSAGSPLNGTYDKDHLLPGADTRWSLPVQNFPMFAGDPPEQWVSVEKFGAKPDSGADSTEAIRKAFNSGASTIYFPHGKYLISDNIDIPPSVRAIEGMTSTLHVYGERSPHFLRDQGMFRAHNSDATLIIERLAFDNSYLGDQVAVEADGSRPLLLRDVVGAGVTTLLRPANGNRVFIENTCCGTVKIAGKRGVWARQLDSEGGGVRIENDGAPLWILGLKTEQDCTAVDNRNGAQTEVLGGLLYITGNHADPQIPAFKNTDAHLMLSYAEEAFSPRAAYVTHVLDSEKGIVRKTGADTLPKRTIGCMVPGVSY